MKLNRFIILSLIILVTSCANKTDSNNENDKYSAEELLEKAEVELKKENYKEAITYYAEIQQLYPFSKLAQRAQIMEAYSYYSRKDFDMTALIVDEFIKLHPGSQYVAYAHYLKSLCFYNQIPDIYHDQTPSEQALMSLEEIIYKFPDSEYAQDARVKLALVRDRLAGKEMEVGRFYLATKEYISAINRFQVVVNEYQTTVHSPEALYRLSLIYYALGLKTEAVKYAIILGENFPDSKWYRYCYNVVSKIAVKS